MNRLRTMYLTFLISLKIKETHFKIHPAKEIIKVRLNINDNVYSFCETNTETTDYIFCSYSIIHTFWLDILFF